MYIVPSYRAIYFFGTFPPRDNWLEWLFSNEDEMNDKEFTRMPQCIMGGICGIGGYCRNCYLFKIIDETE